MTGAARLNAFSRLNVRTITRIWQGVSLRPLFATLIAFAMLFAPLAMETGSAMAMVPADHQNQMMQKGHCGEQPTKGKDGKAVDKPCCVAMCTAVAVGPVSPGEPHAFLRAVERPSPQPFRHGYLAKLATPPPRRA